MLREDGRFQLLFFGKVLPELKSVHISPDGIEDEVTFDDRPGLGGCVRLPITFGRKGIFMHRQVKGKAYSRHGFNAALVGEVGKEECKFWQLW